MSNVVAIVEQAAEIFVSGARLMIPSLFWQTPRAAEVFGGILYRANLSFHLSGMTEFYARDSCCQPANTK
jgi:hypothetical protein